MPLTVNVGLSRKASENYQSTGVSINLTAELDQSLLARPDQLQQQVQQLYQEAESALDRQTKRQAQAIQPVVPASRPAAASPVTGGQASQANGSTSRRPAAPRTSPPGVRSANGQNGNGHTNSPPAPMTASQSRAINGIARRLNIDPAAECKGVFGWELAKLSVREASDLIDHLKALQPAGDGGQRP